MALYVVCCFVIICGYGYVYATEFEPFIKNQNTGLRLLHQYKIQQLRSHLHCLIECSLERRCKAVNYQRTSQRCELNNRNIYDVNGYNSEITESWTVYTKGIPSCSNDWLTYEQSCYYFSTEQTAWHDAATICQNKSATLVQLETEDENDFLLERLTTLHGESWNSAYWTNGNDFDDENQWVWGYPDGQAIGLYRNWELGDPNGNYTENCIALYGPLGFNWVDVTCSNLFPYICEANPST